ncbi:MAG: CHAT domain-containing protein [Fulvivirga sp.]|nr:CHAT domain-containing protein [Fulvivirga sp.]
MKRRKKYTGNKLLKTPKKWWLLRLHFLFFLCLLLSKYHCLGQSQDEFNLSITAFYTTSDTTGFGEKADELFKLLQETEELQTYANYIMLSQVYEKHVGNEKMVQVCKDRAQEIINQMMGTNTGTDSSNPSDAKSIWFQQHYPRLFTTTDPKNAIKALDFLENHTELHGFNNFTFVAYAFERNKDFEQADTLYKRALQYVKNELDTYHPFAYYTNFLSRTGKYLQAQEQIKKIESLARQAENFIKLSYRIDAMSTRAIYNLHIGNYQKYASVAADMYDFYKENFKENVVCNNYDMSKYVVTAFAYETLGQLDTATTLWGKYDSAHHAWVRCNNKTYPNNQYNPLSMLPAFNAKIGNFSALEGRRNEYIQEVLDHYSTYETYADLSINHQKATHLAFLNYENYHDLFQPIIERIEDARDFTESTQPIANYAYFTMRDRQYDRSFKMYKNLFKINISWLNDLFVTFGEKAFVIYYNNKIKQGYDNFHSFVKLAQERDLSHYPHLTRQAFDNLLLTKSIAFKGSRKRKKTFLNAEDDKVRQLYEQWLAKKQELIYKYQTIENPGATEAEKNTVDREALKKLQQEVDQLENELANQAKNFKEYLEIEQPDWKSVRNKLKDNEAAIEMVRFQWRDQVYYSDTAIYAAYIVKKDSQYPEVVYLTTLADHLDNRYYNLYKNSIRLQIDDDSSYNQYWAPIKNNLKDIEKVYFSPDGIYHLINLPALQNPETGEFLLDEINLQYVTSTAAVQSKRDFKPIETAALFGRPAYEVEHVSSSTLGDISTRSLLENFRDATVADLPGTEDEVIAISKKLRNNGVSVATYIHDAATEEAIYSLKNPDILHIATHGYWSEMNYNSTSEFRTFNAMVNSGLLFSGVVNYYQADELALTHDGVLTAYEAQQLNLDQTELVVLSACETGLGHLDAGEGVYGLQRAFRAAGANSIILSLWKVDDQATRDFMVTFYEQYLQSGDKITAFHATQKAMKEKYKKPFYWGAFVLVGN